MLPFRARVPNPSFRVFVVSIICAAAFADATAAQESASPKSATPGIAPPAPEPEPEAARAILVTNRELTAQLQIFLDQQLFSPGMIDGKPGRFVIKALKRWQR